jgi:coproporphyrinogen III oxidase-like Fe-S oxidoreductase
MAIDALGKSGIEQYEISNFCRPGFASRHNLRYWQRRPYLGLGLDASSMLREALPAENAESIDALKGHGLSRAEPRPKDTAALAAGEMQTIEQRFPQGLTPETPDHAKMARLKPSPFKAGELAASSGCSAAGPPGHVLRCTTASDLKSYFENRDSEESTWLSPSQQHEEAWFLGLRLNAGVEVGALEQEFGAERIAPALEVVKRLAEDGLLIFDGGKVWLTPRGQLLSNDVFQEFLGITGEEAMASRKARA